MKEIQRDTHLPKNGEPPSVQSEMASRSSKLPGDRTEPTTPSPSDPPNVLTSKHQSVPRERTVAPENPSASSKEQDAAHAQNPATIVSFDVLKEVFSEDEDLYTLSTKLIQLLRTVQKKADLRHRLHLFVESDRGFAGGVPEGQPEVMHRVQTRLTFSPTLSASDPRQQSGLSRLYGELTYLSFQRAPSGSSYVPEFLFHKNASD